MVDSDDLSPIEEVIADAKQGKMCVLVDDEARENEGDLVIPAEKADAEAVNFMAKHARGLVCLALTKARVEELGLPLMAQRNTSRFDTAFTVSIEAREGVTTGISAADRAVTIAAAIDEGKAADDIVTPGHIFPIMAREGGVLVRAGHTEAAVDIARLAELTPAAVICEIMKDDGSMARMPDLVEFAKTHGLKIATIADLIAYRRRNEQLVERTLTTELNSRFGGAFTMHVYVNTLEYAEHVALVKGDVGADGPVLVRMHAMDVLSDMLGDAGHDHSGALHNAMEMIDKEGRGVVVVIREPRRDSLSERVRRRIAAEQGQKPPAGELRDYGIGAQILLDLGVREMILLTNSQRSVVGLDGYGLTISGRKSII